MPPMPYPITRNRSILAVEKMLNVNDARSEIQGALEQLSNQDELAKNLNAAFDSKSPANAAVEAMLQKIGAEVIADSSGASAEEASAASADEQRQAGIEHLDLHWFGAGSDFWSGYSGKPAEVVRLALVRALRSASGGLPIQLIWVCGSPSFEASISSVRDIGGVVQAVVLVLSTPETVEGLYVGGPHAEDTIDEDHYVVVEHPLESTQESLGPSVGGEIREYRPAIDGGLAAS